MSAFNPEHLRPGHLMCYRPSSPFGKDIAVKSWTNLSHVETWIGAGNSVAARWEGVDVYPERLDKYLCLVLEPTEKFDLDKAMVWFYASAQGLKYDLWGMRIFYRMISKSNPNRMWCSELCAEFYRQGGFDPFSPLYPSDRISPAQFAQSGKFNIVWNDGEAYKLSRPKMLKAKI